jgi:hypothetical protein
MNFPCADFTITKAVAYCDTIGLYCWRHLPGDMLSQLRREYGKRLFVKPMEFGWWIEINQPTRQTLTQLAPFEGDLFCLSRVDIATDLLTNTKAEAINATSFLAQNAILKWRRDQESVTEKTTTYWSNKTRRNIVAYGDKLSKVTDQPCAHWELRFVGASAVKRAGIDFRSLIQGVDTLSLLQHQTKLATIDHLKLQTILMRYPDLTLDETRQKVHRMLLRATGTESIDGITSQALWDVKAFRGCLRQFSWSYLVSQPIRWCGLVDATQAL